MAHARRVDANQPLIVETFRQLGAKVAVTSSAGDGMTDLVIQFRSPGSGRLNTELVEVKDPAQPPSKRRLTPRQEIFHSVFNCHIVETVQDCYELMEIVYKD